MSKSNFRSKIKFFVPCLLSTAVAAAWAQPASQSGSDVKKLDSIVVSASGTAMNVDDAPASISVITRDEIEKKPVQSLADILKTVPGISGGLSSTGEQAKIRLRGLDTKYTLILVDGKRVGNSENVGYRPDLVRQDLNWISPDIIERIEVVRGPMSSLYGSDAMGGVINIITKKTPQKWGGSANVTYTHPSESTRGKKHTVGFNVAGPVNENLGLRINASSTKENADKVQQNPGRNDPKNGISSYKNNIVSAAANWRVTQNQDMKFEVSHGRQNNEAYLGEDGEQVQNIWGAEKLTRQSYSIGHEGRWVSGNSSVTLQHVSYDSPSYDTAEKVQNKAKITETTLDGRYDIPLNYGVEQIVTVGGQWKRETLENSTNIGTVTIDYEGQATQKKLNRSSFALFVEDQLFLTKNLDLTLGLRLDRDKNYGTHASPRAYLVYRPAEFWTVKGGVARGFRAPSVKEASPSAATYSRGNGCQGLISMGYEKGGCYMVGNPDLKPETSTNAEIGVGFNNQAGVDGGITYYTTEFKNKIDYLPHGSAQDSAGKIFWFIKNENIAKAETSGLEATLNIQLADNITWRNSLTYTLRARNKVDGSDLINMPKTNFVTAIGFQPTPQLYTELSMQHTGKQVGRGEMFRAGYNSIFLKSYQTYDFTASYEISKGVKLRGGVLNIINSGPRGELNSDENPFYVTPRSYFIGVTATF